MLTHEISVVGQDDHHGVVTHRIQDLAEEPIGRGRGAVEQVEGRRQVLVVDPASHPLCLVGQVADLLESPPRQPGVGERGPQRRVLVGSVGLHDVDEGEVRTIAVALVQPAAELVDDRPAALVLVDPGEPGPQLLRHHHPPHDRRAPQVLVAVESAVHPRARGDVGVGTEAHRLPARGCQHRGDGPAVGLESEVLEGRPVVTGKKTGKQGGVAGDRPARRCVGILELRAAVSQGREVRCGVATVSVGRAVVASDRIQHDHDERGTVAPRVDQRRPRHVAPGAGEGRREPEQHHSCRQRCSPANVDGARPHHGPGDRGQREELRYAEVVVQEDRQDHERKAAEDRRGLPASPRHELDG